MRLAAVSVRLRGVLVMVGVAHAQLHPVLIDPVGDVVPVRRGDRVGARVVHPAPDTGVVTIRLGR